MNRFLQVLFSNLIFVMMIIYLAFNTVSLFAAATVASAVFLAESVLVPSLIELYLKRVRARALSLDIRDATSVIDADEESVGICVLVFAIFLFLAAASWLPYLMTKIVGLLF